MTTARATMRRRAAKRAQIAEVLAAPSGPLPLERRVAHFLCRTAHGSQCACATTPDKADCAAMAVAALQLIGMVRIG